jgi:hypothetical protein
MPSKLPMRATLAIVIEAALLQYTAICGLKDAKKYDFEVMTSWLDDHPLATDAESRPWKKSQFDDLRISLVVGVLIYSLVILPERYCPACIKLDFASSK